MALKHLRVSISRDELLLAKLETALWLVIGLAAGSLIGLGYFSVTSPQGTSMKNQEEVTTNEARQATMRPRAMVWVLFGSLFLCLLAGQTWFRLAAELEDTNTFLHALNEMELKVGGDCS